MKHRRPDCPNPHKRAYRTLDLATYSARTVSRTIVLTEPVPTLYAYECVCERWHLTRSAEGRHVTVLVLSIPDALQEWARTRPSEKEPA